MKTKLKDKMVQVQVIIGLLIYSLDRLTTKEARKDDIIEIPSWMVAGLVAEKRVTTKITAVQEEPADEDDEDDEDDEGSFTVAELKELTEVDLVGLETTEDCIKWADAQDNLIVTIHPACKLDTSLGKIFAAIEELSDED